MRKIFDTFNLHTTQVSLFKDSQEHVVPKRVGGRGVTGFRNEWCKVTQREKSLEKYS